MYNYLKYFQIYLCYFIYLLFILLKYVKKTLYSSFYFFLNNYPCFI
jgi:hypothetical protein